MSDLQSNLAYSAGYDDAKAEMQAELDALKAFVRGMQFVSAEPWWGVASSSEFRIYDNDGKLVAKGKDCLAAWEAMNKSK